MDNAEYLRQTMTLKLLREQLKDAEEHYKYCVVRHDDAVPFWRGIVQDLKADIDKKVKDIQKELKK